MDVDQHFKTPLCIPDCRLHSLVQREKINNHCSLNLTCWSCEFSWLSWWSWTLSLSTDHDVTITLPQPPDADLLEKYTAVCYMPCRVLSLGYSQIYRELWKNMKVLKWLDLSLNTLQIVQRSPCSDITRLAKKSWGGGGGVLRPQPRT